MMIDDLFSPDRWETHEVSPPVNSLPTSAGRTIGRQRDRFLKGPISWPWLQTAMKLPGKALAIGLMLWLQHGITNKATVLFCLSRADREGIPTSTARRAIRELEKAGLVEIRRKPGRGLQVTILAIQGRETT
jgi:hypothetical protein